MSQNIMISASINVTNETRDIQVVIAGYRQLMADIVILHAQVTSLTDDCPVFAICVKT